MNIDINNFNSKKVKKKVDILILGAGMIGLSLAYQISRKYKDLSILILDKESKIGMHNSGRNSGVLHAGIYYKPGSLRAKVCVEGAKRLKEWCLSEGLNVLNCGKVIVTQKIDQNKELDLLMDRAMKNGAKVEFIDNKDLKEISPFIRNATDKSIWSPNTCVVDPISILERLSYRIKEMGVKVGFNSKITDIDNDKNSVSFLRNGIENIIYYGHLFNCCGVNTDEVAKKFNISEDYKILPFKGIYWQLKSNKQFSFKTNIYPVPDLNLPFLGVHITPNLKGDIFLGPTAVPAFGKENYNGINGFDPLLTANFIGDLSFQMLKNLNGFRRYAAEQAFQGFKPFFVKAVQDLIPSIKSQDLIKSNKVGIRAQLFDIRKKELIQDFKLITVKNTTHVLNAISPAFTASFALADLIIERSKIFASSDKL